ncbi:MAG: S46 family peptidase [Polyangiaceae bacterium]
MANLAPGSRVFPLIPLLLLGMASSCGGEEPRVVTTPPVPTALPTVTATAAPSAPAPYVPKAARWENPGGMWMPSQMGAHAAKLKELGLAFDPAKLTDPTSDVLGAVVSLGGCSASFVSPEGLIVTNHHCAIGALQFNSSPTSNLLHDGFLAKTRADEKSNGPTFRVFVTQKSTDVTAQVRTPAVARMTDRARFAAVEKIEKELVSSCEKDRPGIRCTVGSFSDGAKYYLIEQLELRDIRLVYAPAEGVGNFGGEIDNWRWPRHAGDTTFFRAYVGKDGKPADYSPDNVPFKPPHHLKVASKPLREGDLVFVAGYPGRTYSLKTKTEVEEAVQFSYPRRIKMCEDYLASLEAVGKRDPDAAIKGNPFVRRFGNALTNAKGQLEGLTKNGLLENRTTSDRALAQFIDADPARKAKFGKVLAEIEALQKTNAKHREADAELRSEITSLPKMVSAAVTIVRMAEERPKADKDRDPDFQERNWPRLVQALEAMEKQFNEALDKEMLSKAISRALAVPKADRTTALALLAQLVEKEAGVKASDESPAAWNGRVDALYAKTTLKDTKRRVALLKGATIADLRKEKDPLIAYAFKLRVLLKDAEEREKARDGRLMLLKPAYVEALTLQRGQEPAADANSTLRISYGTVRGYKPTADAPQYRPFTPISDIVKKHTGKEPFDVPENVLGAIKANRFGPYVDADLGEVPVDFLADLHITGGNSGSATLNDRGEITGLVFDGNYEAIASDWVFVPTVTRSIHVDFRYVLWLLDATAGAGHLLKEMGVKPAFSP